MKRRSSIRPGGWYGGGPAERGRPSTPLALRMDTGSIPLPSLGRRHTSSTLAVFLFRRRRLCCGSKTRIQRCQGPKRCPFPVRLRDRFLHDLAVNQLDASEIMVVLSNYNVTGIYWSGDGGDTFEAVEGNLTGTTELPGPSIRSAAIVPFPDVNQTVYLIGTSTGLFSTTELRGDDTEWLREAHDEMGDVVIGRIAARASDGRVAVATLGRGIFVGTVDPASVVAVDEETVPDGAIPAGSPLPESVHGFVHLRDRTGRSGKRAPYGS